MHPIRRCFLLLLPVFITAACLKPYVPDIDASDTGKIVVYGQLTGKDGFQKVFVSMASSLSTPAYLPVRGCRVKIADSNQNEWLLDETAAGEYQVWIDSVSQLPGQKFMVSVEKAGQFHIQSDFDAMPSAVIFDSLYFA